MQTLIEKIEKISDPRRQRGNKRHKLVDILFIGFVRAEANKISESLLLNKIVFYLWNDVCKDGEGDIFNIKISENETEPITFSKFFEGDTTQKLQQWMDYLTVTPDTANQGNDTDQTDATTETENE